MIYVMGIGPGNEKLMTLASKERLEEADHIIGHARHREDIQPLVSRRIEEYTTLTELKDYLSLRKDSKVVVLASGDPCIYGIGEYLTKVAKETGWEIQILNGISSIQYLFSRIGLSMNNVYITSSHGKVPDFDLLAGLEKVAMVTDEKIGPYQIAQEMLRRKKKKRLIIGENLSYPEEKIRSIKAEEVEEGHYDMNVTIVLEEGE